MQAYGAAVTRFDSLSPAKSQFSPKGGSPSASTTQAAMISGQVVQR